MFNVLVVDDEDQTNGATCGWLQSNGYVALSANSVETAKALLNVNNDVDIALVDMRMEEDQAGLKLIEYISQNCPWIISIILTGYPALGDAALCMKAGAFGYLIKGESPEELMAETLREAGFKRASLATLQDLQTTFVAFQQQLSETRRELIALERKLADKETEILRMQDRVKQVMNFPIK